MEKSIKFTNQYLQIIEECLKISWDGQDPVFVPSETNEFSIQRLRICLTELFDSELHTNDAIVSVGSSSKEIVSSVAFGLSLDFDKLIKVGFLNSPRIILWDILWSRGLLEERATLDVRTQIGSIACELLLLKDVVKDGGLIILPPPAFWSEKARYELNLLKQTPYFTAENMGLVSALSICDDLYLHPYTLFAGGPLKRPMHPAGLTGHEMFSSSHYMFHNAMQDLLEDKNFSFIKDVRASTFYKIVAKRDGLKDELYKEFAFIMNGKSRLEQSQIAIRARENIIKRYNKTNQKIKNYIISLAGGSLSTIAALGTFLTSGILFHNSITTSLAIGGLSGTLLSTLANTLQKEDRNILITTFVELSSAERYEDKCPTDSI